MRVKMVVKYFIACKIGFVGQQVDECLVCHDSDEKSIKVAVWKEHQSPNMAASAPRGTSGTILSAFPMRVRSALASCVCAFETTRETVGKRDEISRAATIFSRDHENIV